MIAFLLLSFYIFCPLVHASSGPNTPDTNVIIISIDTLRWDRVFPEGAQSEEFNLGRFSGDSVKFTNLISHSSWTLPSHGSLFTGHYPYKHGALLSVQGGGQLDEDIYYYPEQFQKAGYQTVAFTDGGYISEQFGFSKGFTRYEQRTNPKNRFLKKNLHKARDWMGTEATDSRPFFMFLHTYQVHDYWRFHNRCVEDLRSNHSPLFKRITKKGTLPETLQKLGRLNPDRVQAGRLLYECEVSRTRRNLRTFFRWLREHGYYEDSLIVLFSDHGEGFSLEREILGHGGGQLNESLVKVPLLVKLPDNRYSGKFVTEQIPVRKLFPLLSEELGFSSRYQNKKPRELIVEPFSEQIVYGSGARTIMTRDTSTISTVFFARTDEYKLITHPRDHKREYYEVGPESINEQSISKDSVPLNIRRSLRKQLREYMRHSRPVYRQKFQNQIDRNKTKRREQRLKQLRGLGYMD